jgi:hypothetical protein
MLVGVVLLGVIATGLLVRDAIAVRGSLLAAQESLASVQAATGDIDLDRASAALDRADGELADARSRSGGPLWALSSRFPVVGDSVQVTREVVRVASAAVDVAERVVIEGGELLGTGLDIQVDDGALDLAPLLEAQRILAGLPVERLASARDRLEATDPRWAPDEVLDGRLETLALADEALGTIERGQALLSALPGFLGADEPRRYFLGIQTPAELRGTGGLIGFYAVLSVGDGRFELGGSGVYETFDDGDADEPLTGRIGQLGGITDGASVDEEFRERYDHTAAAGFFTNVNVDPDLPTTAAVALDLFEARTGETLDGLILVDPIALERILTAIGEEISLPTDVAGEADLPGALSPQEFARFATVDIYDQLGAGRSEERKLMLRVLGDRTFERVFDGEWDGVAMSRAVGEVASHRNLQVFSRNEEEQAAFGEVGVTGALAAGPGADLLAVTANNAVGGKQDVHLGHEVTAEIALDDPRRHHDGEVTIARRTALQVTVDNPLPTEGMDLYVIGNCTPEGASANCFAGPPGVNRTWFTTWQPGATSLVAAGGTDDRQGVRAGTMRGFSVYDRYLETPSEGWAAFEVTTDGRAPATLTSRDLVYELVWWEQSKGIPTLLDLAIVPPEGWRIAQVVVDGGGEGRGFGVHGDGQPLAVEADDGRAHLRGTVSADVRLRVHLADAADETGADEGRDAGEDGEQT